MSFSDQVPILLTNSSKYPAHHNVDCAGSSSSPDITGNDFVLDLKREETGSGAQSIQFSVHVWSITILKISGTR